MTHLSTPPSEVIGRAVAELATEAGGDASRCRALNKAQYHMTVGDLPIVPTVSGFLVPSGSRAGVIHRVSTADGFRCDCEAGSNGRGCWHVEIIRILERAAKYTMPRLVKKSTTEQYAAAVAAMDELYA